MWLVRSFKVVAIGVLVCIFSITSNAGSLIVNPCEDIYIVTTYGDAEGYNTFLKFDISSIPTGKTIDSVFLEVYAWFVCMCWQGYVKLWNVNSQTWTEADSADTIWNFPTSDLAFQTGFATAVGWTKSVDITPIFLRDYDGANTYCSIKMKAPHDFTMSPVSSFNSNDTLKLGLSGLTGGRMYFYPRESTDLPKLIVYWH